MRLKNTDLITVRRPTVHRSVPIISSGESTFAYNSVLVCSSWVPFPSCLFPNLGSGLSSPATLGQVWPCDRLWPMSVRQKHPCCFRLQWGEKPMDKPCCLSLWYYNWWHSRVAFKRRQLYQPGVLSTLPPGRCAEHPANPQRTRNKREQQGSVISNYRDLWGSLWTLDAD